MPVLRRCPLAIAQRLVHCAIVVSTAVLGQSHKDNDRCTAVDEQLGQLKAKEVQLSQPLPDHDLFWANLKVQLHLPPLRSLDLAWNPVRAVPLGRLKYEHPFCDTCVSLAGAVIHRQRCHDLFPFSLQLLCVTE